MKKMYIDLIVSSVLLMILFFAFALSMFGTFWSKEKKQEILNNIYEFRKSDNFALLTNRELIVNGNRYKLNSIKYNDHICTPIILDETGFYGYSIDRDESTIYLLFIEYDELKIDLIKEVKIENGTLYSRIISNGILYYKYYTEVDNHRDYYYYIFNPRTLEESIISADDYKEEKKEIDNKRSTNYSFKIVDPLITYPRIYVTNSNNVTKRIDRRLFPKFDEGKYIADCALYTGYTFADNVFEKNGDVYFSSEITLNLDNQRLLVIYKWNYESETCEVYSCLFLEYYYYIDDIYIFD